MVYRRRDTYQELHLPMRFLPLLNEDLTIPVEITESREGIRTITG